MKSLPFILFLLTTLTAIAQVSDRAAAHQPLREESEEMLFGTQQTQPQLLVRTANTLDRNLHQQQTQQHLLRFIYQHFRYPPVARDQCLQGTLVVSFTIGADGLIDTDDIQCPRDLGGGTGEEAIRIIRLMATLGWRWDPGRQWDRAVPVRFHLPIRIKLQ